MSCLQVPITEPAEREDKSRRRQSGSRTAAEMMPILCKVGKVR